MSHEASPLARSVGSAGEGGTLAKNERASVDRGGVEHSDTAEMRAMRRALELARRGPRGVNPQVGAVILSPSGTVLAEGWHRGAGTPHAEADALSTLTPAQSRGATAVVTLEPCNHTGRTGPCAVALIEAGVARVVYATTDPNVVAAGGAERLRAAGVDVTSGLLQDESDALLHDWIEAQRLGRPFVTVKWAQSLDGRIAAPDGTSRWITGASARADVHRRRGLADAIVVGTGTVFADDPALTARTHDDALQAAQPLAVVLGDRPIPANARLHRHPRGFVQYPRAVDLDAVLAELGARGVQRVFVEGGPTIASAFLRHGLADEVLAYIAPVLIGGDRLAVGDIGVDTLTDAQRLDVASVERLGDDLLVVAVRRDGTGRASSTAARATTGEESPTIEKERG
jgi:diaminohydroxyphosphoribosylaminopyrimidine deaminase/5-amino-6-(5-phosphoribosylamino)uracil reductase